jgi:hypothetical protein
MSEWTSVMSEMPVEEVEVTVITATGEKYEGAFRVFDNRHNYNAWYGKDGEIEGVTFWFQPHNGIGGEE